jgi:2'-5' RNA ligase
VGVLAPEAPLARRVKNLAFKTAAAPAADVEVRADEGVVTAIVSVTGIVDDVDDIVLPGAYADTLTKRRPKVCWHHAWEQPIGRTLHIEELMPGDKRLPAKTPDGKAWPAEAGALVAAMQFNLDSQAGREAFSAVRFYSETGECEWSIGYRVPPGKSVKDKAGRRLIRELELFELSFVLFGCNDETGTLSVKQAVALMLERKNTGQVQTTETDDVAALHAAADGEIDWAEVEEAAAIAPADDDGCSLCGEKRKFTAQERRDAPTLPGSDDRLPIENCDDVDAAVSSYGMVKKADKPRAKRWIMRRARELNCTNRLPDAWTKKQGSKALAAALEVKAEGGADRNRGGAENLRRWYVHGGGAALIEWGTPGDWARCVAIAGEHMDPEQARGYCQLRHHDALGVYAGQEHDSKALSAAAQPGGEAQTGVMVAVYPPTDVAAELTVPDGDPPEQLHVTLGFLGNIDDTLPDGTALGDAGEQIMAALTPVAAAGTALAGVVGGIGQFPPGPDGTPVWAPVDVPGLSALREQVVAALAAAGVPVRNDHGFTPHMTLGYDLPDLLPVPMTDLTFTDLTVAVGDANMTLPLGASPAEGKATAYSPALDIDRSNPPMPTQTKSFPTLAGSYQERLQAIDYAVTEALLADVPRNDDGEPVGYYVSVVGTYDDRVIATLCHWQGNDDRSDYEFPYSIDADNVVVLGDPVDVTLSVTVEVDDPADAGEAFGDMLPIAELLDTLIAGAEKMLVAKMETKAGRVLSAANESRLQAAVESLLKVLAAAGVHIGEPEAPATPAANVTTPESTAPSAQDVKTVDAADLAGVLAALETA